MTARPTDPSVVGPHAAFFWATPRLRVLCLSGSPTIDDARALIAVVGVEVQGPRPRFSSLVDVRELGHVDDDALSLFLSFTQGIRDRLAQVVVRSAVIHADNAAGAVVAGYTRLIGEPFPTRAFVRVSDGMAWLGFAEHAASVEGTLATIGARRDPLTQLRAHLDRAPRTSLGACAKALGRSARSLQRQLRDASTSYREEVTRARVEKAKRRLRAGDEKILTIARELGFKNAHGLVRAFLAATGLRPAAWRKAMMAQVPAGEGGRRR